MGETKFPENRAEGLLLKKLLLIVLRKNGLRSCTPAPGEKNAAAGGGNIAGEGESMPAGERQLGPTSSAVGTVIMTSACLSLGLTLSVTASLAAGETSPELGKSSEESPVWRCTMAMKLSTSAWMILGETA